MIRRHLTFSWCLINTKIFLLIIPNNHAFHKLLIFSLMALHFKLKIKTTPFLVDIPLAIWSDDPFSSLREKCSLYLIYSFSNFKYIGHKDKNCLILFTHFYQYSIIILILTTNVFKLSLLQIIVFISKNATKWKDLSPPMNCTSLLPKMISKKIQTGK